ncbi:copper homeostasis protein CutC [Pendulispora albinea]|uniref:Copper homeostasis protein cutC homolog n=1 Tax=Pendulispora albinea TaxID=2741071 RepID=A0ABZ2LPL9_9BACT
MVRSRLEVPPRPGPSRPILEVIALDAEDARRAVDGGADRLELVSGMEFAGLNPTVETFVSVRAAVSVPLRVMIRLRGGFSAGGPSDVQALAASATALRQAGADEFVLGWLDDAGDVDIDAVRAIVDRLDGCAWTFHKAMDSARDREAAYAAIRDLPGLDTVLTSGGPALSIDVLIAEAERERAFALEGRDLHLLVGGGLREQHLAPLRAGGLTGFHIGSAARQGGSWSAPVSPELVRRVRDQLL